MEIKREIIIIEKDGSNRITVLDIPTHKNLKPIKTNLSLWEFNCLNDLISFCRVINKNGFDPECSVFSKNKAYRLCLKSDKRAIKSLAGEYSRQVLPTKNQLKLTTEHWQKIIEKSAVKTLSEL